MRQTIQRDAIIEFEFPDKSLVSVACPTVGQYRAALALEDEVTTQEDLVAGQAAILTGNEAFVEGLTLTQCATVVRTMMAAYLGHDPNVVNKLDKALKKKAMTEALRHLQNGTSGPSTSAEK